MFLSHSVKHSYLVDANLRFGSKTKNDPVDNTPNRVTVQGQPMALNDLVIVTVDDTERQSGVQW